MNYEMLEKNIVDALNYADQIATKYKELKTMELSGLKDSVLYKNICSELENCIKKENRFYKNICINNEEEIEYMITTLCSNYDIDVNQSLESLLHSNEKKFVPALRVVFKFENFIKDDYQSYEYYIDETELNCHLKFQKNLLKNYCLVLESFIKRYVLEEPKYNDTNLYIKYLLSFINSDMEKEFCKSFDFNSELFLDYKMYGDFFRMSNYIQEQYINLHLYKKFIDEIDRLLRINDLEFDDLMEDILVSEIILKSVSVFFDDSFMEDLLNDLNDYVFANDVLYPNNKRIIANILNLNDITKKDKAHYSYLSLKLPTN